MIIRIEQALTDYNKYVDTKYPNPVNIGISPQDPDVLKVWATDGQAQEFEFAVDLNEFVRAINALKEYGK